MIIFGAWSYNIEIDKALILDEDWREGKKKTISKGLKQSKRHIRLVHEEEYGLKIFTMYPYDNDKSGMKDFTPKPIQKKLQKVGNKWYAIDEYFDFQTVDEIENPQKHLRRSNKADICEFLREKFRSEKEMPRKARFKCSVCSFDFEKVYGEIGKEYIHVHHKIPLSEIKQEYKVNPTKDLIPVCPNCHAMIHRKKEYLDVEELKKLMKS